MTSTSASGCLIFPPYGGSAFKPIDVSWTSNGSARIALGEDAFHGVNDPIEVDGQRASGLRFADVAVQALLSACWCSVSCLGVFPTATCATIGLPCWVKALTT